MCVPPFGQQAVDMRAHLLKKLIPTELSRVLYDFLGIDFHIRQARDRSRNSLGCLFCKENT
jgi:hypothetical protein